MIRARTTDEVRMLVRHYSQKIVADIFYEDDVLQIIFLDGWRLTIEPHGPVEASLLLTESKTNGKGGWV